MQKITITELYLAQPFHHYHHPEIQNSSKINYKSLNQYLKFNYLLFENTFYENIKLLKAANYLEINQENKSLKIQQKQYWHLSNIIVKKKNYKLEEAKKNLYTC